MQKLRNKLLGVSYEHQQYTFGNVVGVEFAWTGPFIAVKFCRCLPRIDFTRPKINPQNPNQAKKDDAKGFPTSKKTHEWNKWNRDLTLIDRDPHTLDNEGSGRSLV